MPAVDSKEALMSALSELPEPQVKVLLEFVEFLRLRKNHEAWTELGAEAFGERFGPDEPEYTEGNLKPELDR